MPNIKSAVKRVKVSKTKTLQNSMLKSALRSTLRKCRETIAANGSDAAEVLKSTTKAIDKAAAKGLLHKKTAARRKSKLAKAVNAASK